MKAMEQRTVATINLAEKYFDNKMVNVITINAVAKAESICIIFL
jgi:hypothetical protein